MHSDAAAKLQSAADTIAAAQAQAQAAADAKAAADQAKAQADTARLTYEQKLAQIKAITGS